MDATQAQYLSDCLGVPTGNAARMKFGAASITLVGGVEVILPKRGVTAIVGGNNTGKSTVLRQLHASLTNEPNLNYEAIRLIEKVKTLKDGSDSDFLAWMIEHATVRMPASAHSTPTFKRATYELSADFALQQWKTATGAAQDIHNFFVTYTSAIDRGNAASGCELRGNVGDPPEHVLHHMQDDATILEKLNNLSLRIFDTPLTLDSLSRHMSLRVGRTDVDVPKVTDSQADYRHAIAQLPALDAQGDGMRSLLGLLLPLVATTYPVVIVDEPEAFLHPPQAHALGLALGSLTRDADMQIILATHDRNLLAGLLASECDLSVVRLSRTGNTTTASQLRADQLRAQWADPVLRYSNILDGLFHRLVILAENERDCRFYNAALDAYVDDPSNEATLPASDVLFVPTNGKDAMVRFATTLRGVAVPVIASPDLDILNNSSGPALRRLLEALGHDWVTIQSLYDEATTPFRIPRQTARVEHVYRAAKAIFDETLSTDPNAIWTAELKDEVATALRVTESPWRQLKEVGDRAFKGQAGAAANRLLDMLDELGIVAVRVGELEGFAPTLEVKKGPAWVPAALAAGAHKSRAANEHLKRLLAR